MIEPDTKADAVWATVEGKVCEPVTDGWDWTWAELTRPAPYFKDVAFVARFGERWFLFSEVDGLRSFEVASKEAALLSWRMAQ